MTSLSLLAGRAIFGYRPKVKKKTTIVLKLRLSIKMKTVSFNLFLRAKQFLRSYPRGGGGFWYGCVSQYFDQAQSYTWPSCIHLLSFELVELSTAKTYGHNLLNVRSVVDGHQCIWLLSLVCLLMRIIASVIRYADYLNFIKYPISHISKEEGKYQESIQSSTIPDTGHHMDYAQVTHSRTGRRISHVYNQASFVASPYWSVAFRFKSAIIRSST